MTSLDLGWHRRNKWKKRNPWSWKAHRRQHQCRTMQKQPFHCDHCFHPQSQARRNHQTLPYWIFWCCQNTLIIIQVCNPLQQLHWSKLHPQFIGDNIYHNHSQWHGSSQEYDMILRNHFWVTIIQIFATEKYLMTSSSWTIAYHTITTSSVTMMVMDADMYPPPTMNMTSPEKTVPRGEFWMVHGAPGNFQVTQPRYTVHVSVVPPSYTNGSITCVYTRRLPPPSHFCRIIFPYYWLYSSPMLP